MLFRWWCTSFHFLIHKLNSTYYPTLNYSNIFLFTTAFLHFLIYIFNVTFSATLRYFNILLFTTFPFHFLVCIIKITLPPNLTHSNIFLFTTARFTPLWYVRIKIWIGGVTCCLTCLGCLIYKTDLFWRRLVCTFLFFCFCPFFLCSIFQIILHYSSSIDTFYSIYQNKLFIYI